MRQRKAVSGESLPRVHEEKKALNTEKIYFYYTKGNSFDIVMSAHV